MPLAFLNSKEKRKSGKEEVKYNQNDLVKIAKRENNTKRNYLVVNPLQGKHIPVQPSKALHLFTDLADTFREAYQNERLLLVGFAETATAIGAQVAISLGANYIQTTREPIPNVEYLFFTEDHSHAMEQKLVKDDIDDIVDVVDRIVFIEDEVTTGNTILNIVNILDKEYTGKFKYAVASLLNGMNSENIESYQKKGIPLHYLLKTNHDKFVEQADEFAGNGDYYPCLEQAPSEVKTLNISGCMDARRLVDATKYQEDCDYLWHNIKKEVGSISGKHILVVGTEEFMFPALYIGRQMEKEGNGVVCHSTTRSPIAVSLEETYPLHSRYELKSLYDTERRTFLYDIAKYDKVFIITDAPKLLESQNTLVNALKMKNNDITMVRWC